MTIDREVLRQHNRTREEIMTRIRMHYSGLHEIYRHWSTYGSPHKHSALIAKMQSISQALADAFAELQVVMEKMTHESPKSNGASK